MSADRERLIWSRYDFLSPSSSRSQFNHGAYPIEEVEVYARAFAQPGNTRGALEWYRAFPMDHANALVWKRNPLTIPALALGGDHRWGPKIVAMLEEFARNVSGGSIPDCGHWVVEERPAETAEALLKFLAQ
jgi:pimeloyl-ACP methyl ester carboxylesterase